MRVESVSCWMHNRAESSVPLLLHPDPFQPLWVGHPDAREQHRLKRRAVQDDQQDVCMVCLVPDGPAKRVRRHDCQRPHAGQ